MALFVLLYLDDCLMFGQSQEQVTSRTAPDLACTVQYKALGYKVNNEPSWNHLKPQILWLFMVSVRCKFGYVFTSWRSAICPNYTALTDRQSDFQKLCLVKAELARWSRRGWPEWYRKRNFFPTRFELRRSCWHVIWLMLLKYKPPLCWYAISQRQIINPEEICNRRHICRPPRLRKLSQ